MEFSWRIATGSEPPRLSTLYLYLRQPPTLDLLVMKNTSWAKSNQMEKIKIKNDVDYLLSY